MTFASTPANNLNTGFPYVSPDAVVAIQDQHESAKNSLYQHLSAEDTADPAKYRKDLAYGFRGRQLSTNILINAYRIVCRGKE